MAIAKEKRGVFSGHFIVAGSNQSDGSFNGVSFGRSGLTSLMMRRFFRLALIVDLLLYFMKIASKEPSFIIFRSPVSTRFARDLSDLLKKK